MVSMSNHMLQAPNGPATKKKVTSKLTHVASCPLCHEPMEDGQKTDFRQLKMPGYTIAKRVHSACGVPNG